MGPPPNPWPETVQLRVKRDVKKVSEAVPQCHVRVPEPVDDGQWESPLYDKVVKVIKAERSVSVVFDDSFSAVAKGGVVDVIRPCPLERGGPMDDP